MLLLYRPIHPPTPTALSIENGVKIPVFSTIYNAPLHRFNRRVFKAEMLVWHDARHRLHGHAKAGENLTGSCTHRMENEMIY
jgi:hypothetical protein